MPKSRPGGRSERLHASAPAIALPVWKRIAFACVTIAGLVAILEGGVRLLGLDRPSLQSLQLPEEHVGLIQSDRTLFWSLHPDTHAMWEGTRISINHQGTRGEDIQPKQPGELRILSLGESSTFGSAVSDDETYSWRLEEILGARLPDRRVTVINAGVPTYSSFQSLMFLETRGFAFEPDIVLFYHELNDYLPTSLRDSSNNEIGVIKTDRQLYASSMQRGHRALMAWSAVYRWLSYSLANARIRKFDKPDAANPLVSIGLPGYALPSRLTPAAGGSDSPAHNDRALGRRVSEEERLDNLERLTALCKEHGVRLVLLHPAYRDSTRHECLLTRFAAEHGVLMFETFDSLHPPNVDPKSVYKDAWHPGPEGHAWLARDLATFLVQRGLTAR